MIQNIFDAHSEAIGQIQREMNAGLVQPDPAQGQPGTIVYAGKVIPAIVGIFEIMDSLISGGLQRSLDAFVYVRKSDMSAAKLPGWYQFNSGENLDVTQPGSPTRKCQVQFVNDKYSIWVITVSDVSQNA